MKRYIVYILKCRDSTYYTGVTNDLLRRLEEHQNGTDKSSYTYNRRPIELMFQHVFDNPNQAIEFEKQVKGWSRKKKEALINGDWSKIVELSNKKG